jgi:hypothetical protein
MEELKTKLIKIFEKQTIKQCLLKKKENEEYIKEDNLIISIFEKSFYDDYLSFTKKIDNFSNFTNILIGEVMENYDKYSIENIIEYLNESKYINKEKYEQYKLLNENDGYIDQLEKILTKQSFQTNKKGMELFVELYLKIKNNKKLFLDYENSHYEDMLQSIGKIINNVELMINSTLTKKIKTFSNSVFSYFDNFKKLILENNIVLTNEDQSFFNNIINETKDEIKKIYNNLIVNIEINFNNTKNDLDEINIYCFKFKEKKEVFLNDFDQNKNKLNKIINKYESTSLVHIDYFKNQTLREFQYFNDQLEKKIQNRYSFFSKENIFDYDAPEYQKYESIINTEYEEYNYFNEEDWKNASFSKGYKWIGGIFNNYFIHDHEEDKKKISKELIKKFKDNFDEINKNILKFCQSEYDNIIMKLRECENILNTNWNEIRKKKKKL